MTVVPMNGQSEIHDYEKEEGFSWSKPSCISAVNRWRAEKIRYHAGSANPRGGPKVPRARGVQLTEVEKDFLRKATRHLVPGERVDHGVWTSIASDFNDNRLAGRPIRNSRQIRKAVGNLDKDDVDTPVRRTRKRKVPLMDAEGVAAEVDQGDDVGEGDEREDECDLDQYEDLYGLGEEQDEDAGAEDEATA